MSDTHAAQGPADYVVTFTHSGRLNLHTQVTVSAHSAVEALRRVLRDYGHLAPTITRVMVPVADLDSLIRDTRTTT